MTVNNSSIPRPFHPVLIPGLIPGLSPVLIPEGDAEWVADLFDTFKAGDLDVAAGELEALLGTLRRAAKARGALSSIEPSLLRRGLEIRAARREAGPCR